MTQHLRWVYANADGVAINRPGRIHYARLVGITAGSQEIVAVLRDGTAAADDPVLALNVVAGVPDDWPVAPVTVSFLKGLYVQFTGGTSTTRLLMVGWEAA